MAMKTYDVAILGAGPGGYVAAIRAAQLGLSVCVIEKAIPGGVCLNWGCIPSKSLIHQASEFLALAEMESVGVKVDRGGLDYAKVHAKSRDAAATLAKGVGSLLAKNKVEVIKASGRIEAAGKIVINDGKVISAKAIIIATGSRPAEIPGFSFDETVVMSSSGILASATLPKSIVILGAGAIGCEFAYVMNAFGVSVTLVEMAPHILPTEDFEAAKVVETAFRKSGIAIHTQTRAVSWKPSGGGARVTIENNGKTQEIGTERILAAFGRRPNTDDIGLDRIGVKMDGSGRIETGDFGQTNIAGIHAIGDVTTTPALAHVASKEGEMVVEHLAGLKGHARIDANLIPSAVYCEPQLAGFGLREDEAMAKGIKVSKSVFPYRGAGKSVAIGKTEGLVKILADPKTGEILGGHVVGSTATELLHVLMLAKSGELLAEDIGAMMFAHPTLSETIMEAARGIGGKPIHM